MTQPSYCAILPSRLEPQDPQRLRNNHALLLIVRPRNSLEDLQTLHSRCTPCSFVWDHTADGSVEDARGGAEVERTW